MEEDFYATIKLKTGEEIYCKTSCIEDQKMMLLISNPVFISEIRLKNDVVGYKLEPWLKTTTEDLFLINLEDVLTISESNDMDMIMMYESYVSQTSNKKKKRSKINRKMGYISSVEDAKKMLENLFKNS